MCHISASHMCPHVAGVTKSPKYCIERIKRSQLVRLYDSHTDTTWVTSAPATGVFCGQVMKLPNHCVEQITTNRSVRLSDRRTRSYLCFTFEVCRPSDRFHNLKPFAVQGVRLMIVSDRLTSGQLVCQRNVASDSQLRGQKAEQSNDLIV